MTLPYFLKDIAPPFLTDQHCLVAPQLGPGTAPDATRLGLELFRQQLAGHLHGVEVPLADHVPARIRIEPDGNRITVDPAELDMVRCLSCHGQQAIMKRSVVASRSEERR